jgi:hypothetical protein
MGVVISIRVICGFLAGLAAGILIMRMIYKSKGAIGEKGSQAAENTVPVKVS